MKLVAVTACPTGIAHSQMAAENLQTTAEERGHEIHVEVQGAMGTENEIPDDVLAAADAVIIAADTSVQQNRFGDHVVVKASVKDGVNDADGLIDEAIERAGGETDAEGTETNIEDTEADTEETADTDDSGTVDDTAAESTPSVDPESTASEGGIMARLKRLFS
ncbi:PTS system fructose-specific IIB component [Halohasta litchfieldiae]|jgi:PTS system fructose-specific IIB component|uniref:PTS system, fructose-specific IIB component n=1 Tax=Halohasta litchfieldiae TaxID=1073996 RepID=A0A1H6WMN1_9EURY|nr:PTS fructose transporter subunit IIB [Halohasta litchfieldiae]ATW89994.1 PTS system fructose-specific IIB component [Halohasta litchfieldiae]SEJ13615.1 PTS system, fructose-specific IIB component [Halohasta litchfieldiae]